MEVDLTTGDLATVAGAAMAAGIIVQFLKMLFNLNAVMVRTSCLIVGLGVVLGAGLTQGAPVDFPNILLLIIVGMMAGMSAYTLFDTARSGFDYQATRRSDSETEMVVTPIDPEDQPTP